MIRSISYSRYFRTATAMAMLRHRSARLFRTTAATEFELVRITATKVTTTRTAAAANHFSCSRSSPVDRANLTTIAEPQITRAARMKMTIAASTGGLTNWLKEADGCAHEPRGGPPPRRAQVSRREEQEQEGDQGQGGEPDPCGHPVGRQPARP